MTEAETLQALQEKIKELQSAKNDYDHYLDLVHHFGKYLESGDNSFVLSLACLNFLKKAILTGKYLSNSAMAVAPIAFSYDELIRTTPTHLFLMPAFASIISATVFAVGEIFVNGAIEAWWAKRTEQNVIKKIALPKPVQDMLQHAANSGNLFIEEFLRGNAKPTKLLDQAVNLEESLTHKPTPKLFREANDLLNKIAHTENEARSEAIERLTADIDDKIESARHLGLVI